MIPAFVTSCWCVQQDLKNKDMTIKPENNEMQGLGQRAADRFASELPLHINGVDGLTKNVSATGVYFETTAQAEPGSKVSFVVEVMINGQNVNMVCSGQVVRVDHKDDKVGVAVKLTSSFFTDAVDTGDEPEPDEDEDEL